MVGTSGKTQFKFGGDGSGLPCCPHCGSMLMQIDNNEWWAGAVKTEKSGRHNYVAFLRWTEKQPRCWPDNAQAALAYNMAPESFRQQYNHLPFN